MGVGIWGAVARNELELHPCPCEALERPSLYSSVHFSTSISLSRIRWRGLYRTATQVTSSVETPESALLPFHSTFANFVLEMPTRNFAFCKICVWKFRVVCPLLLHALAWATWKRGEKQHVRTMFTGHTQTHSLQASGTGKSSSRILLFSGRTGSESLQLNPAEASQLSSAQTPADPWRRPTTRLDS